MTSNIWLDQANGTDSWLTSLEEDVNALRRMLDAGNGDASSG